MTDGKLDFVDQSAHRRRDMGNAYAHAARIVAGAQHDRERTVRRVHVGGITGARADQPGQL
jgi:hypothetical protein